MADLQTKTIYHFICNSYGCTFTGDSDTPTDAMYRAKSHIDKHVGDAMDLSDSAFPNKNHKVRIITIIEVSG
jgi:hypothetical protein